LDCPNEITKSSVHPGQARVPPCLLADEKALEQPRKSPGKPAREQLFKAPKGLGKLELIHFKPYDFNVLFQVVIGRRYFCWSRD